MYYNEKLGHGIMQFQSSDWLSGHGIPTIISWLRNNVMAIKLSSGLSCKNEISIIFMIWQCVLVVCNKTVISLVLVGYGRLSTTCLVGYLS